jgi:lipoate-protein ligase A
MLRPVVRCDRRRRRIDSLVLDGDFFAFPRRGVFDLEACLKGARTGDVGGIVRGFMDSGRLEIPGVGAEHLIAAISEALERRRSEELGLTTSQANSTFVVGGAMQEVVHLGPTHLLLPYCAKPVDCEHRNRDSCDRCGACGVGDSYDVGERAGLEVHTITSFEHLMDSLSDLRRGGAPAYVGSCCESFYVKHRQELESHGLPGILIDVAGGESCYDLGKNSFAYRGEYEGRSRMDVELLEAVLATCEAPR